MMRFFSFSVVKILPIPMRFLERTTLFAGMFLIFMSISAYTFAAPPGGHLNITEVLVDVPDVGLITIKGADLDFGNSLVVTLGEFGSLAIISVTDFMIVAELPVDIPDGEYLLTVSRGRGQSQNDEFDLTISGESGAAGPLPCPDGFTEVNDKYCIETDQNQLGKKSWVDANSSCISNNTRLCTAGEWVHACLNAGTLGLNDLPSGNEWLGDLASGVSANRLGQSIVSPSCTAGGTGHISLDSFDFRCCFSR